MTDLRGELGMNLPAGERLGSVLLGAVILAATATSSRAAKWGFLSIGAALVWRGWMGRCPWYSQISIDRRH